MRVAENCIPLYRNAVIERRPAPVGRSTPGGKHARQQFRVVQWATGNIGGRALREVIRHPALELVGVLVYDPAKEGVDAGVLCGEEPTGVFATTDREAVHALDADCVLYMPRALDVE